MMPGRLGPEHFYSLHRHGFVRVATSTPRVRPADVSFNRDAILEEARRAHAARVDLVRLSGAWRLRLRHRRSPPADRPARRGRGGDRRYRRRQRRAGAGSDRRRAAPPRRPALQLRGGDPARRAARRRPEDLPPELPRVLREALVRARARRRRARRSTVAGRAAPFGTDLLFEATRHSRLRLPRRDLRGLLGADSALHLRRDGGRDHPRQPLRLQHHHRQGRRAQHALRLAIGPRRLAAYVYAAAGAGESTTDLAWDGQIAIYELGEMIAEVERFPPSRCSSPPTSTSSASCRSAANARPSAMPPQHVARTAATVPPHRLRAPPAPRATSASNRPVERFPFVPDDPARLDQRLLRSLQHPGAGPAPPA